MNRYPQGPWKQYSTPNYAQAIISRLLVEGYGTWMSTDPTCYDSKENSATARLVTFTRRAARAFSGVAVVFTRDEAHITSDIGDGLVDANRSPRPDITVWIGSETVGIVECKWVDQGKKHSDYAKNYVVEGIQRFMPGGKYVNLAPTNLMVGYLIEIGRLSNQIEQINSQIGTHLGRVHRLEQDELIWHKHTYHSVAAVLLQHLFFEVPESIRTAP